MRQTVRLISLQGTRSRNPSHSDHPCARCAYNLGRLVIFLDLVSFQNNPATPSNQTAPGTPRDSNSSGTLSNSPDSSAVLSVSSSSSRAPEIPPMALTASVPAPVSVPPPAPAIPSSGPPENDSQILPAVQTSAPTVSLDGPAPQEVLPGIPAVSNTIPAPEPSAEPPSPNPPPVIASNDTPISQTATNIASTSKDPQNPAPAKGSRKKATKNPPKPKKMTPAKLVSNPVLFVLHY